MQENKLYGLLGEFDDFEALLAAVRRLRAAGFRRIDTFSPFSIEEMPQAMGLRSWWLPLLIVGGALLGAAAGYGLQYYVTVIDYPLNIGGRPLHSWPAFIPVAFETAMLGAAGTALLALLVFGGLPRLHHPLFKLPVFARATQDRYFLLIEARDGLFHPRRTRLLLLGIGATEVFDVEP